MSTDRLRVLVSAEAANPEWVSSPLVAWSHYEALARVADVHLVTHVRNQAALQRVGLGSSDFTAIDSERFAAPLWNLASRLRGGEGRGWTTLKAIGAFSYYYYEHLLWQQFADRIERGEFDVIHRLAPISPTWPSPIAERCERAGVPFVAGPLNGGLPWPKEFAGARRREREWLSYVRRAYRWLPGYASTRVHARALVIASRATLADEARWRDKCIYVPENAIDSKRFTLSVDRPIERPLRLAFVGRLVPYKGPDMLLEAAAPLVRSGDVTIDMIGEGPERANLERMTAALEVRDGVKLDGFVEHAKLQRRLVESDILAFPSIREFGGGVVLEAMALGLLPLIVDYGGPAELVTDETGVRVPMGSREQIVSGFRCELERLVADPSRIREMGSRARTRIFEYFTWDAKAQQMLQVFEWAMGRRNERPDFGLPLGVHRA